MTTKQYSLTNGVRVLETAVAEARSTTLFITVPHGSRHETPARAGLAHFFEHMVFKGGKRYPTAADISRALDQYGAYYNAFTDFQQTAYYAKIAAEHLDTALDVISDYLINPKLEKGDIDRERGVILEEYNMYWDVPAERADFQISELVFGATNLGRPIIGDRERIGSFKRDDFIAWHNEFYGADRVMVSVAGGIPTDMRDCLEGALAGLPAPRAVEMTPPDLISNGPRLKMDTRDGEQMQLILAAPSLSSSDKRQPVLNVLRTIMGVSMSSRLFTEIREKRGLCYSIRMTNQSFTDTGAVAVSAGLDSARIGEAVGAIWQELQKIATQPPAADELRRAKEFIKGSTILSLEDTSTVAQMKANQLLFEGEVKSVEKKLAEIEAVSDEEVQQLAAELFVPARTALVLVGPQQDEAALTALIK